MSDPINDVQDGIDDERAAAEVAETIERYETDDGIVFYDSYNPLAWMKSSASVPLKESV